MKGRSCCYQEIPKRIAWPRLNGAEAFMRASRYYNYCRAIISQIGADAIQGVKTLTQTNIEIFWISYSHCRKKTRIVQNKQLP